MVKIRGHAIITDPAEAVRALEPDTVIGFDTETTGFSPWKNQLALIQLYGDTTGRLAIIRTPGGRVPQPILDLLERPDKLFIGHNVVNFDLPFMHTHGLDINKAMWFDTLVGETVVVGSGRNNVSKSLRASARRRLGIEINKDIEHSDWSKPELTDNQLLYAADDVLHLPGLMRAQIERAGETGQSAAMKLEQELMPAVAWMVINGMPFNYEGHKVFIEDAWDRRNTALAVLNETFGTNMKGQEINWRSPKQVKEAFAKLGHPISNTKKETFIKNTYKGGPLGRLSQLKLNFSQPDQSVKTYHEEWISKYVETDGRVHFKFWQCGADTTRFTSSSPNGQQIPRKMRGSFGNVPGHMIVSADYAQIEIRIAADVAEDQALIDALAHEDVHTAIAAESFGIPYDEVTKEQRRDGKGGSFLLIFGGGAQTLYEYNLVNGSEATLNDAYDQVRNFFSKFRGLKRMKEQARRQAQRKHAVIIRLPTGHRRILAGWQKRPQTILNTMIQGTAAGGMKLGMIDAHKKGLFEYVGAQFHDELDSTVPTLQAEDFAKEIKESMIRGMTQVVDSVPVYVDTTISRLWEK